ncbi:MAG: TonB-dependent receptor [Planctomycetes bacterium]|nr:TonB-dependent receptor [Planctomycetota bacterium]
MFRTSGSRWFPALIAPLVQAAIVLGQTEPPPKSPAPPKSETPSPAEPDTLPPAAEAGDETGDDLSELSLEELMATPVVVSASRRAEPMAHVPYAIAVITADDIRRAGAHTVPDALRLVPGVDVAQLSATQFAVSPRGLHGFLSGLTLILVDGRQMYDPLFGGMFWSSWPIQVEDIARIEVIRGPAGVAWGANATNGIINIISKDPGDQQGATLTLRGGSRGTHAEHLDYAWKDGPLRMRISTELAGGDGFRKGGSLLGRVEDDYLTTRVSLHGIYEKERGRTFTFSAGNAVMDRGFALPPMVSLPGATDVGTIGSYVQGKWTREIGPDEQVQVTAYVNDFHLSYGAPSVDYGYQQLALNFGHSFKPADRHLITWGLDTRVDLFDATNSDPGMLTRRYVATPVAGMYVEDEWRLSDRWVLHLSGRADYDSYGGFEPSGRAALTYKASERSSFFAAVSRTFSESPAAQRFLEIPFVGGLVAVTGDRQVDAHTLIAYEAGWRARPTDKFETAVNFFWHDYDHLPGLQPLLGPPGLLRFNVQSVGDTGFYGVGWSGTYKVSKRWTLLAHYTYQQAGGEGRPNFHFMDLMSPPEHKAMFGARFDPRDDLHFAAHLYYVDSVTGPDPLIPLFRRHIDPYLRLDLRAEYEFPKRNASLAVGVQNLLDDHHPEGTTMFLNDTEVPTMVYAELRMVIK